MTAIRKVLVANRGEIATRVIRACREQSIATVAVYSEVDEGWPHVREADQAVPIGPAPARDSYLSIERIIEAARGAGADAIHPGYGFLSENWRFARACEETDLVFVGPPSAVIRKMGDKVEAKRAMAAAGVPVVPGSDGPLESVEAAREVAAVRDASGGARDAIYRRQCAAGEPPSTATGEEQGDRDRNGEDGQQRRRNLLEVVGRLAYLQHADNALLEHHGFGDDARLAFGRDRALAGASPRQRRRIGIGRLDRAAVVEQRLAVDAEQSLEGLVGIGAGRV